VREARKRAGLNQHEVSECVGIFRSYLSRIETGTANPTLLVMDAIAKALKTELWELLNEGVEVFWYLGSFTAIGALTLPTGRASVSKMNWSIPPCYDRPRGAKRR
jgi:transcriptional regulator with XRE-family HTH domain